jgi:DNA-binding CsgD family transcriptional regulator/NTP pyrophosphatase (non-canonical NTP hydrolase)
VVTALTKLGITVLSPKSLTPVLEVNGFVILEKDKGSPGQIEWKHLLAIGRSDFLYVVNPSGFIGHSVALEIGYALSKRIPIYSMEDASDEAFRGLLKSDVSLEKIKSHILRKKKSLNKTLLKASPTLVDLQNYVAEMVRTRGFSAEELNHVVLLLIEEVGELAKTIRLETGIKLDKEHRGKGTFMDFELADCLIYLLDLANIANINLEDALREKEILNSKRSWVKQRGALALPLSGTELKVFKYIADGYANQEIASCLNISEQVVKDHVSSILRKLKANDRNQAVAKAFRQEWMPVERR